MDSCLNNRENIESIATIIRRAVEVERFALIVASYDSVEDQKQYIHSLQDRCTDTDITLITIELRDKEPIQDLRPAIEEHLNQYTSGISPSKTAIQVLGLEASILSDLDERFPGVLQSLDTEREHYCSEFPYPLLFWLSEDIIAKLSAIVPDFWLVCDGKFTFHPQKTLNELANAITHFEVYLSQRQAQRRKTAQAIADNNREHSKKNVLENLTSIYRKIHWFRKGLKAHQTISPRSPKQEVNQAEARESVAEREILKDVDLVYRKIRWFILPLNVCFDLPRISWDQEEIQGSIKDTYNRGMDYHKRGDYQDAITYYQQALKLSRYKGRKQDIWEQYLNLGNAWKDWGKFEQAMPYYTELYTLTENNSGRTFRFVALEKIAKLYGSEALDDEIQQRDWLETFLRELKRPAHPITQLYGVALFLDLCHSQESRQKRFPWLVELEQIVRKILKQMKSSREQIACYQALIDICHELGHEQRRQEYRQRLEELMRFQQLYLWLEPGTIKNQGTSLILDTHRSYTFQIQFTPDMPESSWILRRIPQISLLSFCTSMQSMISENEDPEVTLETEKREDDVLAETSALQSHALYRETPSELSPQQTASNPFPRSFKRLFGKFLDASKKQNVTSVPPIQVNTIHNSEDSLSREENPITEEFEIMTEVFLTISGEEHIHIDKSRGTLFLKGTQPSEIVHVTINPQKPGKHQFEVHLRTEDDSLYDRFVTPFYVWDVYELETVTVNAHGEITQQTPGRARQYIENLGNGIVLEMVYIPGGTFLMGVHEDEGHDDEQPQHEVTIAPFFLGKFPITQQQWELIRGDNPSYFKGARLPVERISWNEAREFCKQLSEKTEHLYRLPSEAEWEYACRAGATTPFHFGETLTTELANYNGSFTYASEPAGIDRGKTTDVGSFPPNAFGLYDMHGNVWEWCADPWHENYEGAPSNGDVWKIGGDTSLRILRGGSWVLYPKFCRSTNRDRSESSTTNHDLGLRVVMVPPE